MKKPEVAKLESDPTADSPRRDVNPKLILTLAVVGTMLAGAMAAGGVLYVNGAAQPTPTTLINTATAPAISAAGIGDFKWEGTPPEGTTNADGSQTPATPSMPGSGTTTTPGTNTRTGTTPVAPAPPAEPVVVAPPPPPPPPPVDHTPRLTHNSNYTPGCNGAPMFLVSSQETSQGGGIIINVPFLYDVTTYDTPNGYGVNVYGCDL